MSITTTLCSQWQRWPRSSMCPQKPSADGSALVICQRSGSVGRSAFSERTSRIVYATERKRSRTMAAISEPLTFDSLKKQQVSGLYEMTIQPEQARRIARATITTDTNFRHLSDDQRLAMMVDQMKRGEWIWTDADPIRLHVHETSGEIVASDGQHRLQAAAQARRVLRTLVLFGPEWISGLHVDRNRPRNVAQYLAHERGIKNPTALVALVRTHLSRLMAYERNTTSNYQRQAVTDEMIIEHVHKNQEELMHALNRYSVGSSRGFNSLAYACALYEFRQIDHEMADQFHRDMQESELEPTDPLMALRRQVASRFNATGKRANREYSLDNLVKAWNLRAGSQTVTAWRNASDDVFLPFGLTPTREQVAQVATG